MLNINTISDVFKYLKPAERLREGCQIENRSNLGHCPNTREGGPKDCPNVPTLI